MGGGRAGGYTTEMVARWTGAVEILTGAYRSALYSPPPVVVKKTPQIEFRAFLFPKKGTHFFFLSLNIRFSGYTFVSPKNRFSSTFLFSQNQFSGVRVCVCFLFLNKNRSPRGGARVAIHTILTENISCPSFKTFDDQLLVSI